MSIKIIMSSTFISLKIILNIDIDYSGCNNWDMSRIPMTNLLQKPRKKKEIGFNMSN